MNPQKFTLFITVLVTIGASEVEAKKGSKTSAPTKVELTDAGKQLETKYAALVASLQAEIKKELPEIPVQKVAVLEKAHAEAEALQEKADSTKKSAGEAGGIQGKIANWKKFWTGKAGKSLAAAQASLKAATTDAQREAAKKEIAKWEQNKADGEKAIAQAQAELAEAKTKQGQLAEANQSAQDKLSKARAAELNAAKELLDGVNPFISKETLDAKLAKCALLSQATPNGLAAFAGQKPENAALIDKLLSDDSLIKDMLVAGGASSQRFGQAMDIYAAIQKASLKANDGVLKRLALATSLEMAKPVQATVAKTKKSDDSEAFDVQEGTTNVDPVKRYLHYEKAYLKGELDPAFKNLTVWELRLVLDCNAPDEILQWGRDMIRNYRPDFVTMANYGWRYSSLVKSDVPYGSQNCKYDRPDLNSYQNIIKDGGVCGRRAFFGRFILRANGIPVWGVTQHKHAALSHWTPKGWVVNLGAGFNFSWWDKGDASMSGSDFLVESQARRHSDEFMKVLRMQWVSRMLGEQAYNGRKNIAGGTWSRLAHYLSCSVASMEVTLGALGEELAEANAPEGTEEVEEVSVNKEDQKVSTAQNGDISIPAVAHGKSSGKGHPMKSWGGGMQILCSPGFKAQYEFDAPRAGKYAVTANVVTVQENKKMSLAANEAKAVEFPVPYTIGMWKQTPPLEVSLKQGHNVLSFEYAGGGAMALKEFMLKPVN